jgi:hypothetical protein
MVLFQSIDTTFLLLTSIVNAADILSLIPAVKGNNLQSNSRMTDDG